MVWPVSPFVKALSSRARVLIVGSVAVILHGMSRHTKVIDVWLEPLSSAEDWAELVESVREQFAESYYWDLSRREIIEQGEVVECVNAVGVVRIGNVEPPLDIFRKPNNLELTDFEGAGASARSSEGEDYRILHEAELIVTKTGTPRDNDLTDIVFLESKIRQEMAPILRSCPPEEARRLFARYVDHETCRAALANPHTEVRALATETLRENQLVGMHVPPEQGIASWVARSGQSAVVNDAAHDPRFYGGTGSHEHVRG